MLENIDKENIENIVVFVIDSLRWDYLPQEVLKKGVAFKTIASSLYTASSFPSMVSGLYPPKHGVDTWEDILPKAKRGFIELKRYNISLWCETTWTYLPPEDSQIHQILGHPQGIPLEKIKSPFVYMEDDKGGHCPYGLPFGKHMGGACPDFYKEYGKKGRDELIKQYRKGIAQSVERLFNRIKVIDQRKLTGNTLIIVTSDHGELLGEYGGLAGHGRPPCPELVYVPTVFIHPSLDKNQINTRIIRHVDIYPTIAGILNIPLSGNVDGINLCAEENYPLIGLNFKSGGYFKSKNKLKEKIKYRSESIWDFYGGHVFHKMGFLRSLVFFYYKIFLSNRAEFYFMREIQKRNRYLKRFRGYLTVLKHLCFPYLKYMNPQITKKNAKKIIKKYRGKIIKTQNNDEEPINEEVKKRLEDLGYVD